MPAFMTRLSATHPDASGILGADRLIVAGVVVAEAVLLYLGLWGGSTLLGVALALGGLYLLVAYRWPDLAVALAFVAAPFSTQVALPGGSFLTVPTEPMIILSLGARLVRAAAGLPAGFRRRPLLLPLAGYVGAMLFSCFFSEHPIESYKGLILLLGYVSFGYLAFDRCRDDVAERWVRMLGVLAAVIGGYGVLRAILLGATSRAGYGIGRPLFAEHGTYSAYLSFFVPILMLETLDRRGVARVGFGVALLLALSGIVLSFARAAWLSLAVVVPVTLLIAAVRDRSVLRLAAPAGGIAVVAFLILGTGLGARLTRHALTVVDTENVSNLERVNRWMAGVEMARSHPWTGVGYESYDDSYRAYRRKVIVTDQTYVRMGVHNEALQALAEAGIPGLACGAWLVLAVSGAGLRIFRKARKPAKSRLALGITLGLGTYLVHGFLNAYPGSDRLGLAIWMGIGALAALDASEKEPIRRDRATTSGLC
jgi:O-antigen ligase